MSTHTPGPSRATLLFRRLGQVKLAKSCKGLEPLLAECQAVSAESMHLERTNTAMLEALKDCLHNAKMRRDSGFECGPTIEREIERTEQAIRLAERRA